MQISASTDYAIRLILYLAKASKSVPSSKLSTAIGVSSRYLLQIGAKLRDADLITVTYGPTGGYTLCKSPNHISLYDVIVVMQKQIRKQKQDTNEKVTEFPILDKVYTYVDTVLDELLKSITMDSLLTQSINKWFLAPRLMNLEDIQKDYQNKKD